MKEEALKWADQLDGLNSCEPVIIKACETMIRRLIEELDKASVVIQDLMTAVTLLKDKVAITERDYNFMQDLALAYEKALENKKTKPLSDEEILVISNMMPYADRFDFARAIEERHGIK